MNVAAHNPAGFSITALPEGVFPTEVTPAACSAGSIAINDLTTSPDQVFMVLDRSGSMRETTKIPDFNQDGKTRLEYVQAAARAYVTLVHGQPVDLGLISFSGTQPPDGVSVPVITVDQNLVRVDDAVPAMPPSISQDSFHAIIDGLVADGQTPIGTALKQARDLFSMSMGAQKAVFLLSDGENNAGVEDPLEEVRALRAAGVTVYSVALGDAADEFLSREMAFLGGGAMLDAPNGDEVPMTFLDLFARNRSESLALARTESVVAGAVACSSGEFPCEVGLEPVITPYGCLCLEPGETEPAIAPEQSFPMTVEAGADRLNVMLSSRNPASSAWVPEFRLKDPSGTVVMDLRSRTSASCTTNWLA